MNHHPKPRPKLIGPPASAANHAVIAAIQDRCIECPYCIERWHIDMVRNGEAAIQMKLGGKCIAVRRAMYLAHYHDEPIEAGYRVTSRCKNPNCVNPRLLMQAKPGYILGRQYTDGLRDKNAATEHLLRAKVEKSPVTFEDVLRIRADKRKGKEAAKEWGITPEHYNAIQRGATRTRVYA